MKKGIILLGAALLLCFIVFMSCDHEQAPITAPESMDKGGPPSPPPSPTVLDAPLLSCEGATQATIFLRITAGASGAPAGFTVQWVKHEDYPSLVCGAGGQGSQNDGWGGISPCAASLSGVPGCSIYNLGPGESIVIEIGNLLDAECGVGLEGCGADELECGMEYVFRAFAHNVPSGLNRSPFTNNVCCPTDPCTPGEGCTYTQGYWKTHPCEWPLLFVPGVFDYFTHNDANENGDPDNLEGQCAVSMPHWNENNQQWQGGDANTQCPCDAVNTINIGNVQYNMCQLLCALDNPGEGNALLILAHQLIAAKLNNLNGASPSLCDLGAADALIGSRNILTDVVDSQTELGQQMIAMETCLDLYNNGDAEIPHCP
jgi:hypothetical protein